MTAVPIDTGPPPSHRGWTADDLDGFPYDGYRRELIDGALIVSPTPTDIHQVIAGRLMVALEETCPETFHVTQAVEIQINSRRCFIPDVLVTTAEAAARRGAKYAPDEVLLAVEIVSSGSQAMDRILKPAVYAEAGIPYFWRIETEDGQVVVHTYKLDLGHEVYRSVGESTDLVDTPGPWPIKLPVSRITPRFLSA